jgi:hypothetical protein
VDVFDFAIGLMNLIGEAARAMWGTWLGRSLLVLALASLPIVVVATHR